MSNHKIEMDYSLEAGHTAKCVCGCDIEPVNADNSRDALLTLQVNLGLLSPDHVDQQP